MKTVDLLKFRADGCGIRTPPPPPPPLPPWQKLKVCLLMFANGYLLKYNQVIWWRNSEDWGEKF